MTKYLGVHSIWNDEEKWYALGGSFPTQPPHASGASHPPKDFLPPTTIKKKKKSKEVERQKWQWFIVENYENQSLHQTTQTLCTVHRWPLNSYRQNGFMVILILTLPFNFSRNFWFIAFLASCCSQVRQRLLTSPGSFCWNIICYFSCDWSI